MSVNSLFVLFVYLLQTVAHQAHEIDRLREEIAMLVGGRPID